MSEDLKAFAAVLTVPVPVDILANSLPSNLTCFEV
jgi:hypothetical protein